MDAELPQQAALLWREILRQEPKEIFGIEAMRLLDRHWGDRIAQPGLIGHRYTQGGLAFVSMNPGGGAEQGLGSDDLTQYDLLKKLRESSDPEASAIFSQLSEALEHLMPKWKIYRNFVAPVLHCAELDVGNIAYLNLLKWRTKKSKGLNKLYDLSWEHHTKKQFDLLMPSVVIAIGADAGKAFLRNSRAKVYFDAIPRLRGNNIGIKGLEATKQVCLWLQHNRHGWS